MRAIVLEGPVAGEARAAEVAPPSLGSDEVLCEPLAVGLCHTDVSVIRGYSAVQAGYSPTYPLVLGHEFVARVVETGERVTTVKSGDRIISGSHIPCTECKFCRNGRSELCRSKRIIGLDIDGALAERFVLPEIIVRRIDDSVPIELAVLAEPFAVALHAVELAKHVPGERVAVIGPGPVGLLAVGALVSQSIAPALIGLPADEQQLQLGIDLGASTALTVDEALAEHAGSFDIVIEAAGHHTAVATALSLVGPGGRVVCVGLPQQPTPVDTADLAREEKVLLGSRAYDLGTWDRVPAALAAIPQLARLVTHKLSMDDIELAIRLVEDRVATKVMLVP